MTNHTPASRLRNILQALTWLLELHDTSVIPVPRHYLVRWNGHLTRVLQELEEGNPGRVLTFTLKPPLPWLDR